MIIELIDVEVKKNNHDIVKNINFFLNEGEILSIVGESGIGKTTIIKVISGIEKEYSGKIEKFNNSKCSVVFQEFDQLFPWKTLWENIKLPLELKNASKSSKNQINQIIEFLKLEGHEEKFPHQLSGGMKQRTAIARALIQDSNFLLMDEPFGSLDANVRIDLQNEIIRIVEEGFKEGIIFVTHDIEEAIYISDRIFILRKNFENEIVKNNFKGIRNSGSIEYINLKRDILNKIK